MFELCFHGMKVGYIGYSNREVKSTVGGAAPPGTRGGAGGAL